MYVVSDYIMSLEATAVSQLTADGDTQQLNHIRRKQWRLLTDTEKLAESYEVIRALNGKVFTLRLGAEALAIVPSSLDPARVISRRIQRAFQRHGQAVPMLSFTLEVTPDERNELHLHGAIVLAGLDRKTLVDILREAADKISGRAGARQLQLKDFDDDRGGAVDWALSKQRCRADHPCDQPHTANLYPSAPKTLEQTALGRTWTRYTRRFLRSHASSFGLVAAATRISRRIAFPIEAFSRLNQARGRLLLA